MDFMKGLSKMYLSTLIRNAKRYRTDNSAQTESIVKPIWLVVNPLLAVGWSLRGHAATLPGQVH